MPYKSKEYYLNNPEINSKIFNNSSKILKLKQLAKTQKYSLKELAKKFNCGSAAVSYVLYKNKIIPQNKGRFKKTKFQNDSFFNKLNELSAYWAGFIAADGNLFLKNKLISIGLSLKDISHIKKFKLAIKSNAAISIVKSNNSARICFRSEKIYEDLEKMGIGPNKSLTISIVKVPENLINHFIRGVYDGDGSVSDFGRSRLQLCIVGNKPFLEYLQRYLVEKVKINKVKIYDLTRCKAKRLQYTGIQILKILDFIYKNSAKNTRLERKYKKYLQLKEKYTIKNYKSKKSNYS